MGKNKVIQVVLKAECIRFGSMFRHRISNIVSKVIAKVSTQVSWWPTGSDGFFNQQWGVGKNSGAQPGSVFLDTCWLVPSLVVWWYFSNSLLCQYIYLNVAIRASTQRAGPIVRSLYWAAEVPERPITSDVLPFHCFGTLHWHRGTCCNANPLNSHTKPAQWCIWNSLHWCRFLVRPCLVCLCYCLRKVFCLVFLLTLQPTPLIHNDLVANCSCVIHLHTGLTMTKPKQRLTKGHKSCCMLLDDLARPSVIELAEMCCSALSGFAEKERNCYKKTSGSVE